MLLLWLAIFSIVTIVVWAYQNEVSEQWLAKFRRWLHQRYRQRYGQAAADRRFPLDFWERQLIDLEQKKQPPSLSQLYIDLHGYFFRYSFGLAQPMPGVTLSRREAFRLFVIGFLLRWRMGKIVSQK